MDPRARTPSSTAGDRVYVDVQPQYGWVTGDKEDTLVVDLTAFKNEVGFRKEHLKIQIDNYGNLKVSGERPLGGDRWSRFQRVLHLPEDCDASGIRATFDEGILQVVMPKLVRDQPPAAPAPRPAAAAPTAEGAARKPPAAAAPAPPPPAQAPAPARERAAAAPRQDESELPAAVPGADAAATAASPPSRRPEDRRTAGKTVPEKGKEQVGAAGDKKEAQPTADVAGRTVPPPVPAEMATPHVRKRAAAVEEEAWYGAARVGDLQGGLLRRRPRQLLVNVVVAIMVLVGLGFYFFYRYRGAQDDEEQQHHHPAPSIRTED